MKLTTLLSEKSNVKAKILYKKIVSNNTKLIRELMDKVGILQRSDVST